MATEDDESRTWTGGDGAVGRGTDPAADARADYDYVAGQTNRLELVDPLDSGCCGMAGSFGYEAEHHSMSRAIGRILFEQVAESPGDAVVAPGASCRTQLGDGPDGTAPDHPGEGLASALPGPAQS